MMRADIRSDGRHHSVSVEGVDLSSAVASAFVALDATSPATASLDVLLPVVEVLGAEAEVVVSDDARALLIAAGWTPPTEDAS